MTLKKLPRVGKEIMTPDGLGIVTEIAVIREKVKVRIRQNDDTYDVREYALDQVCRPGETLPERAPETEEDHADNPDFFEEEAPAPQIVRQRVERKPREKTADESAEPLKRRYPRPKGKKQSTEEYFEKPENKSAPLPGKVDAPDAAALRETCETDGKTASQPAPAKAPDSAPETADTPDTNAENSADE